jgi:hypothetical protein
MMVTLIEREKRFFAPPGNLLFTYTVEEYRRCPVDTGLMTRAEVEVSAAVRNLDYVPFCDVICAEGCVGEACRCTPAARAAAPEALCAPVEDCWAVCTQLTLDSPSLCDGVDYDPVTEQCFLTRSCTVENLEESLTMQHWVKKHGAACLELEDFSAQGRHVGGVAVSARAAVQQTYLLEPDVEQVIDLHGKGLEPQEAVMVISGVGSCGTSSGPLLTPVQNTTSDVLTFPVTLERGEYKVCFCDLDLVEDCGAGPQSFVVQVGVAYASPLSCLSAEPTFVRAACQPQSGGGVRCYG